jgi:glycosyltransferase involved in cell wall biosynthesis
MQIFSKRRELKRVIKSNNLDAIHMTTSGQLAIIRDILLISLAKKKNIRIIYHIRFGRVPEIEKNNTLEWKLLKIAINKVSCVIGIDKETVKTLRSSKIKSEVIYIPNPFDTSKVIQNPGCESNTILFIGWVVKTKGIEELLEAWNSIDGSIDNDWSLQIVGPVLPTYKEYLMNRYNLKNVNFVGELSHEEAMKMLSVSKIFVLPSYTEGFPNVVLEAMAYGKPIIATDVGAIPDMLENCGVVIPRKDAGALKNEIVRLAMDEEMRMKLGERAKEKLYSSYTIEVIYGLYKKAWNGENVDE